MCLEIGGIIIRKPLIRHYQFIQKNNNNGEEGLQQKSLQPPDLNKFSFKTAMNTTSIDDTDMTCWTPSLLKY